MVWCGEVLFERSLLSSSGGIFASSKAEGTRFDPAVEASSLPEGAWICDMGTVHYARSVQGDGECPICHMRLVQRTTGDN